MFTTDLNSAEDLLNKRLIHEKYDVLYLAMRMYYFLWKLSVFTFIERQGKIFPYRRAHIIDLSYVL